MTTLITGGASLIGLYLAKLLQSSGHAVLFGSRSGTGIPPEFPSIKLDWYDPTTFPNAFSHPEFPSFDAIYILPPTLDAEPVKSVGPFLDYAVSEGKFKRYVMLTMSVNYAALGDGELKELGLTKLHNYLAGKGVDHFVVKPTWFIENFDHMFGHSIRTNNEFETCVPTGKLPFVSGQEVAQVAFKAITNEKNDVNEKVVVGPESLTYDQAAEILSDVLGRNITHKHITKEEVISKMERLGRISPSYIALSTSLHSTAERGSEDELIRVNRPENVCVGKVTVRKWVEENKAVLQTQT